MAAQRSSSSRNSGGSRGGDSRGGSSRDSRGGYKGKGGGSSSGGYKGKRGGSDSRGSDSRGGRNNSSGRDGYQGRKRRDETPKQPVRAERSGWGSVAQHGAAGATIGQRMDEANTEPPFSPEEQAKFQKRQARRDAEAERQQGLRDQAKKAIDRGGMPEPKSSKLGKTPTVDRFPLPGRPPNPIDVEKQVAKIAGKEKGARAWRLFKRAAKEFQNEQYTDSRKTVKPLVDSYPNLADLHELHGLCLYRLARWDEAIESLETFRRLSGTAEQNPVLMDCHRALGHWADVDYLWNELGELSPSGELVSEGRIVMAGAQADQGFIDSGVRTLEKGWKVPKEPMEHHLRRAYALADLLERDGKIPKSRKLFAWIAAKDETFGDAAERAE